MPHTLRGLQRHELPLQLCYNTHTAEFGVIRPRRQPFQEKRRSYLNSDIIWIHIDSFFTSPCRWHDLQKWLYVFSQVQFTSC